MKGIRADGARGVRVISMAMATTILSYQHLSHRLMKNLRLASVLLSMADHLTNLRILHLIK